MFAQANSMRLPYGSQFRVAELHGPYYGLSGSAYCTLGESTLTELPHCEHTYAITSSISVTTFAAPQ
jgi:hypothetical protein